MNETALGRSTALGMVMVLVAVSATGGRCIAAETETAAIAEMPAPGVDEIPGLIAQLDASDYHLRREATRQLVAAGAPAVEPLIAASRRGSLEAKIRVVAVLEEMYTTGDDEAVAAAEIALETLAATPARSLASRADLVLVRHYDVRERRAVAAIRKLGGIVEYADENERNVRRFMNNANGLDDTHPPIRFVRLDLGWKGGDAGLVHFQRLRPSSFHLGTPVLYLIDGTGVTKEGLENLQAAVPQLVIQNRGRSFLGVQGTTDPNGRGCAVASVEPGSSADKGNVQPGDIIISFNGKPSPTFDVLVELIGETQPGDKVKVEVLRGLQSVPLEVEMSGWRKR